MDCEDINVVALVVSESNKTISVWELSMASDSVDVSGCFDS